MGNNIYSTNPGNPLREGKYLLHRTGNLLHHTCYAQVTFPPPLSSSGPLCYNIFSARAKNSKTFVALMSTGRTLSLPDCFLLCLGFAHVFRPPSTAILFDSFRRPHFPSDLWRPLFICVARACGRPARRSSATRAQQRAGEHVDWSRSRRKSGARVSEGARHRAMGEEGGC